MNALRGSVVLATAAVSLATSVAPAGAATPTAPTLVVAAHTRTPATGCLEVPVAVTSAADHWNAAVSAASTHLSVTLTKAAPGTVTSTLEHCPDTDGTGRFTVTADVTEYAADNTVTGTRHLSAVYTINRSRPGLRLTVSDRTPKRGQLVTVRACSTIGGHAVRHLPLRFGYAPPRLAYDYTKGSTGDTGCWSVSFPWTARGTWKVRALSATTGTMLAAHSRTVTVRSHG